MNWGKIIVLGVLTFIVLIVVFGPPDKINHPWGTWTIEEGEQNHGGKVITVEEPSTKEVEPQNLVTIENITTRQDIYEVGDRAYIDFRIENPKSIDFNFSVDWLYNNSREEGWSNQSKAKETKWWSYYPVDSKGTWTAHVEIRWDYDNNTYSKDGRVKFKVI